MCAVEFDALRRGEMTRACIPSDVATNMAGVSVKRNKIEAARRYLLLRYHEQD
jgi:hypothetical protein